MTDETALYLRIRGEIVRVEGRSAVLGRSRSCDVQVDEEGVSRRHCEVLLRDDGASLRDLGSSRGTWVAGRRAGAEERLTADVLVTLGQHGPHFELVNAIVHGRPVLGAAVPEHPQTVPVARAPSPPVAAAATTSSLVVPTKSRFLAGLAWGVAAGVVAGIVVAALV